jgi:hypothetical protein
MPRAVDGEFNFAASGTCLVTVGKKRAYMASGGAASRVFRTGDRGRTWKVTEAPIPASEAGGVFSLAFRSVRAGVLVGGDFTAPGCGTGQRPHASAGVSGRPPAVRTVTAPALPTCRVTLTWSSPLGPTGTDVSSSGGRHWLKVDRTPFDGVDCARDGSCWASGPDGGVGRLRWR